MRVVLDTNTIVSGIGWTGSPRRILLALREGPHRLITSPELLAELTAVLRYPKLEAIAGHPLLEDVLVWLHRPEHLVYPVDRIAVILDDPADDRVLEAASEGKADASVSGDRHLLQLGRFRGIPIMRAGEFASKHLQRRQSRRS